MTYDAQTAIDLLKGWWAGEDVGANYTQLIDAMNQLVSQAAQVPALKMIFANQGVFVAALTQETSREQEIDWFMRYRTVAYGDTSPASYSESALTRPSEKDWYPPRWQMLTALKKAIFGGFFNLPDPTGLANWAGLIQPAGDAIAHCIGTDPLPVVRGAALDLVKSTTWPAQWIQPLLGALGGLDDAIGTSGWDQGTRAALTALSKDVRARVLIVANQAQGIDFSAMGGGDFVVCTPPLVIATTNTGQSTCLPPAPSKPWYKNGPVVSAGLLGALLGFGAAVHRSK
jgi:hypothetical protein